MRKKLEFIADRIEAVLSLHQIPARVTGGTVTPRWIRFQVLPAVGAKISKIRNLSEELAAALDAPSCRVSRRGAAVAVEVPRDDPQPVRLLPLYNQLTAQPTGQPANSSSIPPVTAILGLAEDGAPLLIRLPSPDVAHILVAGTTGAGKTMLLQTMILSLAMTNPANQRIFESATGESTNQRIADSLNRSIAMVLIDPKGHAFGLFEGLPHLARGVIQDAEEMAEALQSLVRLMELRNSPASRVVVVIDELADLLMMGGKAVQEPLTRLTQRGREAGIHVIAATQQPTTAVLGPLVKANFPVRLVGRVTSAEEARTASGWSGTGAERLLGRGDFIAVAEGRVTRFQVAHVSPTEIRDVVGRMGDGGWRMENDRNQVLSATPLPSPLSRPTRLISLPWPVSQLTGVMRRSTA
jgi:S-DNA-T family DNA segregation ATPase FtsK/SpoIIIE